jgi:hypothetical protein
VTTLYEIADELIEIQDMLIDTGGELTPEIEDRLDQLTGAFDDKVERICKLVQSQVRLGESAKAEARRLEQLSHVREQSASGLKRYLMREMVRTNRRKIELPTCRVRVQTNGRPRIEWTRGTATLPPEYRRVEIMLNSDAAYNHWKVTGSLPDGFTVELGQHLRIS